MFRLQSTKKCSAVFSLLVLGGVLLAAPEPKFDPLPEPLTNNAVASLKTRKQFLIFSFMGMGPKKTWEAIASASYSLNIETGKWSHIRPVPGTTGRIAAMAAGARDHVFLFGGYVVDARGAGMAVPDVGAYQPLGDRWFRGADLPLPVGDAVIGVYQDRFIYLIGGRSDNGVVANVQIYDSEKNRWSQGTPIPTPVFGHAGALVGDTIVFVDGAAKNPSGNTPRYIASDECWMGKIAHHDPKTIQWSKLPSHPGTARYRIAAGGSEKDQMIYFAGGSDNLYDFSGIGYDGKPAEPSPLTFAFNLRTGKWETISENTPEPTMDHHALVVASAGLIVIGGMEKGQQVTGRVAVLSKQAKPK